MTKASVVEALITHLLIHIPRTWLVGDSPPPGMCPFGGLKGRMPLKLALLRPCLSKPHRTGVLGCPQADISLYF
jgi:hypothetical protein